MRFHNFILFEVYFKYINLVKPRTLKGMENLYQKRGIILSAFKALIYNDLIIRIVVSKKERFLIQLLVQSEG